MDAISLSSGNKLAGRYRVLEKLGEGSFAETFLSEDEHLPDAYRCVIKKLKTEVEEEAKLKIAKRLFDEEARTLHQLGSHPNIPQLLAHFEEDSEFYLVEEYVEGISLYQELSTGQRWSESYVVKLVKDLLDVLKFVHQEQVIHRDIKPSNIIRREKDGQIFLIDFGAVKQVTSQVTDEHTMAPHTVIVGTPGYMPGEQLRGSPRMSSDVFAVGMIAIYALTGLNPALGQVPEDEQTAEIIWRDRASVSPEFAAIIDKMVAYDFRQRYPSAQEAADAIQALTLHRQTGDGATVLSDRGVGFPIDRGSVGFPSEPVPEGAGTGTGSITYNGRPMGTVNNGIPSPPSTALEKTSGTRPGEGSGAGTHVVFGMNPAQVVKPEPSVIPSSRRFLKPKYFALGGAAILGLGTIAALASPNIGPICKALNNCSAEVKYNTVYEESQDQAESALTAVNNAKTFQDLQNADTKLKESIAQLSKIPEVVHSYKDAQKVLPNYQKQLKSLEEKITAEKKAQQDLVQADVIAKPVLAQKKISGSVASLSDNKAKLQQAIERVNKVSDKSLTASQGKVQKQAYLDRQKAIDAEIKKQAAIEAEQQRKWAAAEAERQRQQAAANKARPQSSWNSANSSPGSGGGGGSSGGGWSGSSGGGGSSGHSGGGGSSGGGWSGSSGGGGSSGHSGGGGSSGSSGGSSGGGGEQLWGNNSGSSGSTSGGGEPLW